MAEALRLHQEHQDQDQARQILELQTERLRRLSQPESPMQTLGNLAIVYFIGGAMGGALGGTALPRTEALTLEGTVATTEIADELRKAA